MSEHITGQYELLQTVVGTENTTRLGHLSEMDFSRFATAAGIDPADGADPAVAPHLYLGSVMGWGAGAPEADLAVDGTSTTETRGFPLTGVRLMGAGQDLEFHTPVRAGMEVTETTRLDDVQLKEGSSGQFITLHLVRRFRDENGTLLLTCRETFIGR